MELKSKLSLINARTNPISSFFVGFAGLLLLVLLYRWLFTHFFKDITYLQWYFKNAAAIGIGSALLSTVWGVLDEHPDLISAHPMKFMAAYFELVGGYCFSASLGIAPSSKGAREELYVSRAAAELFDSIVGSLLWAILVIIIIVGVLVIGPLQYFVFLICGAPARVVLQSKRRLILRENNATTELKEIHDGDDVPADWKDISIQNKPFTLTNVIVALLGVVLKLTGFGEIAS